MLERVDEVELFFDKTIHSDATVGTYCGTCRTAYTGIRIEVSDIMIAPVIDLFGLKLQHIAGTCYHTEVTTFATFDVNVDCSLNFCHCLLLYGVAVPARDPTRGDIVNVADAESDMSERYP